MQSYFSSVHSKYNCDFIANYVDSLLGEINQDFVWEVLDNAF